ncbi:MAG: hypothetical protein HY073_03590 [Deltaproteobacteria bacterium]|nr:hypothetical protein [Deltaproteobacteria bacterium]
MGFVASPRMPDSIQRSLWITLAGLSPAGSLKLYLAHMASYLSCLREGVKGWKNKKTEKTPNTNLRVGR